jgi:hypothetical protein
MKIKCKNGNTVESWYDRSARGYITNVKNADGYQLGEAAFAGCKDTRAFDVKVAVEQNGGKA